MVTGALLNWLAGLRAWVCVHKAEAAARSQVSPAERINPMPGMRMTVPKTRRPVSRLGRLAEDEQADAEKREDYTGLQRNQNAGKGGGNTLVALEFDWDGRGFEEALAGLGVHVGEELFVVAEALDEAAVDLALHFEDAGPAAIFKEGASEPEEGSGEAEKGEEAGWPCRGALGEPGRLVNVDSAARFCARIGPLRRPGPLGRSAKR